MTWGEFDFGQLSLGSILGLTILAVIRGWLVPRRVLTDRVADAEGRVKDAHDERDRIQKDSNDWRDAYLAERRVNDTLSRQITDLIEANQTAHNVVRALGSVAGNG